MAVGDRDNLGVRMRHISELTERLFTRQFDNQYARLVWERVTPEIAVARLQIRLYRARTDVGRVATVCKANDENTST